MFAVGIDLGTTNSAVAMMKGRADIVPDSQGNRTLPSAIGWDPDFDELIIGIDAKESPDVYSTTRSVKRLMGSDEKVRVGPHLWTPEEWSAEILKVLKKQVEEKTGEPVTDAIITVPAHFEMAALNSTLEAGRLAGLNVQQLLEEPSAAVMAYGPKDDEKILVYDLGGGTFDVSIVDVFAGTLKTLAVFGNNYLGGDDLDQRLIDHFIEVLKKEQGYTVDRENAAIMSKLKREAESVKIGLSRKNGVRADIPNLGDSKPIGLSCPVKRDDFNAMIMDLVDGSLKEVEKALNYAKLDKSDINTVLLVGGSTYVPLVQDKVKGFFGKDPSKKVDPDLAVSLGAATCLVLDDFATEGAEARHVVTVNYIPEATPDTELNIEGRTSPNSTVKINGGAEPVESEADEEGYYDATIPLKKGLNALTITAIDPNGKRAEIEPAPVVQDDDAEEPDEDLPAPPPPRLSRALSISCSLPYAPNKAIQGTAAAIIPSQTDLPKEITQNDFATQVDGQQEIRGTLLEGDLPLAEYNSELAEIRLQLPPNVPAGEPVSVKFTVDENTILQAELECMNRTQDVIVNIQAVNKNPHLFVKLESVLTKCGNRMKPEEKAELEQGRLTLEDLAEQCHRAKDRMNSDGGESAQSALKQAFDRFESAARDLQSRIAGLESRYA